jgi:hypothetical protein
MVFKGEFMIFFLLDAAADETAWWGSHDCLFPF